MRKNNMLASAVLTTMAVMQLAMPVMAAQTNNSMEKLDNTDAVYTEKDLVANGHTTFGVFESGSKVSDKQVSFEVPLYVTMAATTGTDKMTLPKEGSYYIENTVDDAANNPIGVVGLEVKAVEGSKWNVVGFTSTPVEKTDMTFKLGGYPFDSQSEVFYTRDKWNDTTTYPKNANKTTFVDPMGGKGDKDGKFGLIPITGKLVIPMESKIKSETNRADSQTTGVFKVVYTVAMVDPATNQPMASTYVGDSQQEATVYYKDATN